MAPELIIGVIALVLLFLVLLVLLIFLIRAQLIIGQLSEDIQSARKEVLTAFSEHPVWKKFEKSGSLTVQFGSLGAQNDASE